MSEDPSDPADHLGNAATENATTACLTRDTFDENCKPGT